MARILIVDDSSIMRRNLSAILRKVGHTVVAEAINGEEAIIEYEKHRPDLVTMDITMPIMNGIDAVQKIIESFSDAKIIIISALDNKFMVLSALQSGAKHYVIKPFTPEKVMQVINNVLDMNESLDTLGEPEPEHDNNLDGAIGSIKNSIKNLGNIISTLKE